jgi:hypothetical protein
VTKGFGVTLLVAEIFRASCCVGDRTLFYFYLKESFLSKGFEDEDDEKSESEACK